MAGATTTERGASGVDAVSVAPEHTRLIRVTLLVYAIGLAFVAFWPSPVDQGISPMLQAFLRVVPWLSYDAVEFTANIALFVPLGVLLAAALPGLRGAGVLIAATVSLVIETGQGLLLAQRTPSLRDVVANTLGAALGLAIVLLVERRRRAHAASTVEPVGAESGFGVREPFAGADEA